MDSARAAGPALGPQRTAYIVWVVAAALYFYTKALFSVCYALGEMAWKQIHSPEWLFGHVRRHSPPKCLQDPDLGQHGYLTVKGLKFHYVEKGDRSKPLMLFLHGFPEFWYSWRHQIKEFSNDYWTVAVDMRGFGDSAKPSNLSDYDLLVLVDDVKGIVTELGRDKFTLVSHDWGSIITWTFVDRYPEMVDKYVTMNCPSLSVFVELVISFSSKQASKSWYTFLFQIPYICEMYVGFADFCLLRDIFVLPKTSNPYVTENDLEAYKYTYSQPGAVTAPMKYYRAAYHRVMLQGLFPKELQVVKKGTPRPKGLFLFGANDIAVDVKCVAMMKAQTENLETLIIEEGNHFVTQDEPMAVNKAIRSFLRA